MCSVALFTFPPGRRLLIDSWSRSHLFWKFFVSDALSLPCECACVCVCVCVREMPYRCSKCVYVCVCVCVADALSLPTLTGLCRPEIWKVLVGAALSTAWAQPMSRSAPVFLRLYKTGFLFRVSVFSSALKHWARACPLSIRRFQCFHVNMSVGGIKSWEKKKGLINSYPFELSRGTWSQLDAAAFTGSHRRVWCPQKQQQQQQQQQLLSFCLSTSHAQTSTVLHRRMLFFFLCAEGREDDRQQQEHSKVLVSETALPVEAVREFSAVFFSHDLNSLHLKVQEV